MAGPLSSRPFGRRTMMRTYDASAIPESVRVFLRELAARPAVEALILFGSRAAGDHGVRSDVDVAVVGPTISRLEWAQIRDAAYSARTLYWISVIHLDRTPASLRSRVIATGRTLYEKETRRQSHES
jgi:predicted nucleotidyltransferase